MIGWVNFVVKKIGCYGCSKEGVNVSIGRVLLLFVFYGMVFELRVWFIFGRFW